MGENLGWIEIPFTAAVALSFGVWQLVSVNLEIARDRAAKRDFIRDDVVLEINERRDDEQRDEREQRQRHHPCAGSEPER